MKSSIQNCLARRTLAVALLAAAVIGCNDDPNEPPRLTLTLSADSVSLGVDDSVLIQSVIRDIRGQTHTAVVGWSVRDDAIVSITQTGMLRARAPGATLVIGTIGQSTDTVRVFVRGLPPVLTTVSPDIIEAGSSGVTLNLTGARFTPTSVVHWNGAARPTTFLDSMHLTASIGASDLTDFREVSITVVSTATGVGASLPDTVFVGMLPGPSEKRISAGLGFTCALTVDDASYCWGNNNTGQLGSGTTASSAVPIASRGGLRFERISVARNLLPRTVSSMGGCGLTDAGAAYCWGDGSFGALGNGTGGSSWVPVAVAGGHSFVDIAVGEEHVCAVTAEGAAYCWGAGGSGQLGDGRNDPIGGGTLVVANTPQRVAGTQQYVAITAGREYTCALTRAGSVYCWGAASGNFEPSEAGTYARRLVAGGQRFARISAGMRYTCALTVVGAGHCLGGPGLEPGTPTGTFLRNARNLTEISVGTDHTCALTREGAGYCFGGNAYAQLGIGVLSPPFEFVGITRIASAVPLRSIAAGTTHTCVVARDHTAYCWGERGDGILGDDEPNYSLKPLAVSGNVAFSDISVGTSVSCGIDTSKRVWCWGSNHWGELGISQAAGPDRCATVAACSVRPLLVPGLPAMERVSVGGRHSCALTAAGQAFCWGVNSAGQLGDSTRVNRLTAVPVSGGLRFRSISAGDNHSCGITLEGLAYCWGENSDGRLGTGTFANTLTPQRVAGVGANSQFTHLSAGSTFTCGLDAAGRLYCWGLDNYGLLGLRSRESCRVEVRRNFYINSRCDSQPVLVSETLSFDALALSSIHGCARTLDGAVYCWGANAGIVSVAATASCTGTITPVFCTPVPARIPALPAARAISAAEYHTCSTTENGQLFCWGQTFGAPPAAVSSLAFNQIEGGGANTCALAIDGRAYCLGSNSAGQLGIGRLSFQPTPVRVVGGLRY